MSGSSLWGRVPEQLLADPTITATAVRVYAAVSLLADYYTDVAGATQERIAQHAAVSDRTVRRAINDLIDAGWLTVESAYHAAKNRPSNRYSIRTNQTEHQDKSDRASGQIRSEHQDKSGSLLFSSDIDLEEEYIYIEHQDTDVLMADDRSDVPSRRNPYWDALVEVFGYSPSEKAERSLWGRIAKRAAEENVPPGEIGRRAVLWSYHFTVPLTPATLLNRWDWLGGRPANISRPAKAAANEDIDREAESAELRRRLERRDET